jgi:hypothetical protein
VTSWCESLGLVTNDPGRGRGQRASHGPFGMIQNLTFLFWRDLGRQDARPMAEPIRGVWLA